MLGAILGLMAYAAIFWSMIPIENIKVRAVCALAAAMVFVLLYKMPLLGYLLKVLPGPVIMHKWIVPLCIFYGNQYKPEYADKMELLGKLLFVAGSCMYALVSLLFTSWGFFKTDKLFRGSSEKKSNRRNTGKSESRDRDDNGELNIKSGINVLTGLLKKFVNGIKELLGRIMKSFKRIFGHSKSNKKKQTSKRKNKNAATKNTSKYNGKDEKSYNGKNYDDAIFFFRGCNDMESCMRRYNMLMREYHPNKEHGDDMICKKIDAEYEKVCRRYQKEADSQNDKRECS